MPRTYSLVRPIFGFWKDIGQVVKIPAGANVSLEFRRDRDPLCTASWDSRLFLAFEADIHQNGIAVETCG